MADITLRGVTRMSGRRYLLDNVDTTMRDGDLTVLFGDADSGKFTMLRVIAGVEKVNSGEVFVGGNPVTKLRGGRRDVAMVFEKQGLLPHKNIYDNIGFPLRMARIDKVEIARRVESAARRFGLDDILKKKPKKVSEEERHLVGIARAWVRHPAAYLFQAVNPKGGDVIRKRVLCEMQRLVKEDGATVIYATDDSTEALRISDKIIVMSYGAVAQAGSPHRIYRRPADCDIAELFGKPPINLLAGEVISHADGLATVHLAGGSEVVLPAYAKSSLVGAEITLGIRPLHIRLTEEESNMIDGRIIEKRLKGDKTILQLDTPDGEIAVTAGEVDSDWVRLHLPPDYCILFDATRDLIRNEPPKVRT